MEGVPSRYVGVLLGPGAGHTMDHAFLLLSTDPREFYVTILGR